MNADKTTIQKTTPNPTEVLNWHLGAGVDETIGEAPGDRFALPKAPAAISPVVVAAPIAKAPAAPIAKAPPPPKAQPPQPPGQDRAVKSAVELAGAAQTLDELKSALAGFDGCALSKTATNLVFGDGNPDARIAFIAEAPGADDDRHGMAFVGASGKLLDKMLASIGLDREQVFISNTVFWRPPGNRSPNSGEIAVCMPFVERIIELVDPEILVTVGGPATHALLAQQGSISRLRGRWFSFETPRMSRPIPATAIYHPEYLLNSPAMKRPTWQDLCQIRQKMAESSEK